MIQVWWCIFVTPEIWRRLRQENWEFEVSLGYIVSFKATLGLATPCIKRKK
jgi:hypothetical protein